MTAIYKLESTYYSPLIIELEEYIKSIGFHSLYFLNQYNSGGIIDHTFNFRYRSDFDVTYEIDEVDIKDAPSVIPLWSN